MIEFSKRAQGSYILGSQGLGGGGLGYLGLGFYKSRNLLKP